jgi:DNA-binding NarL/FixJ family response regulator
MLATTMQAWPEAEGHFEAAVRTNTEAGARTWLAHTHASFAEMLLKRGDVDDLGRARTYLHLAREAARDIGMAALEERVTVRLAEVAPRRQPQVNPLGLSDRQMDVLRLLAEGRSNKDIAGALTITPNTVANHVKSILDKTGASNRTEAVARGIQAGLI